MHEGQPVGILVGFESEEDYQLENDPRFLQRIAASRKSARAGQVVRLEDMNWE
jgi:hypothetical protein